MFRNHEQYLVAIGISSDILSRYNRLGTKPLKFVKAI